MRQLKKLTCSSDLSNIVGKPYEKNLIDFILYTCEDAVEECNNKIEYHFYYNGTTTEAQIKKFQSKFKGYESYIKIHKKYDYDTRNSWFLILTCDESIPPTACRVTHTLPDTSEQSMIRAFLSFYTMAKQQLQMSSKNTKR